MTLIPLNKVTHDSYRYWFYRQSDRYFGIHNPTISTVNLWIAWDNYLNGYKLPAHHALQRQVLSATTPATGERRLVRRWRDGSASYYCWDIVSQRSAEWSVIGATTSIDGQFFTDPVGTASASVKTSAHNQAVSKLYNQLNSFASAAKTGEDWGEWHATMKTLRSPLAPLRNLLISTHKKGIRALTSKSTYVKTAGALADTHLEFAFGVNPLVGSIAKSVVGLQNREVMGNYHPFHARGSVDFNGSVKHQDNQGDPHNYVRLNMDWKTTLNYSETYQGIWGEECLLPKKPISDILGLRPRDIIPTIWNLIPYSFLVDYFVNIGQIVSAIAVPWSGVKWCNYTTRTDKIREVVYSYKPNPATSSGLIVAFNQSPGNASLSATSFDRSAITSLPIARIEFTRPWQLTGRQWVNLAALAVSQSVKYLEVLNKVVKVSPKLEKSYISQLASKLREREKDPYPFHRY
jgi:hypothetical protein